MSLIKKKIIIGYCIGIALSAVYVPWKIDYQLGQISTEVDQGYSFFFSPPDRAASIDVGKLILELVIITALAGGLYTVFDRLQ